MTELQIQVENLYFAYGARPVLQGVSFGVAVGSLFGIIGPNGSGKSTLLRIMSRTLPPQAGEVSLGGIPLGNWERRTLAQTIAVVGQETTIEFPFTAAEIVMMGRSPYQARFASESKQDWQVVERVMRATDTWDLAQRPVTELSGGERQRVLIARALAQEPQILLLDEPTAHLDLNFQVKLFALLRAKQEQGLTVVIVLHDLNLASQYCDQLLLMQKGQVYACGTPAAVLTEEHLTTVYQTPIRIVPQAESDRPLIALVPQV